MLYEGLIVDNTYQIVSEIGQGGMGVVYLVYHLRLEKYVVLKKIKNPSADIHMLRNEVDILKSLHHPYLPQVYDFIEYNYDLYTVIDYINGYDLNYYIQNGFVPTEKQLIKWLKQLCQVLEYLHKNNPPILHTDIKPGNIIITENGDICLIDFGISLYGNVGVKGLSEFYSSPEQYDNVQCILAHQPGYCTELDARTDVYSLAATFYHLMTGIRPNVTNNSQIPISGYKLNYSDALISIVDKAMSRDREHRFKNTGQMLKALNNMHKADSRYKKYLVLQLLSSVLCSIMIISGGFMIFNGYNDDVANKFETAYNEFCLATQSELPNAPALGLALLNNYGNNFINSETKSQIWHMLGQYYIEMGDNNNGVKYLQLAVDDSNGCENAIYYYRDYIFSLININDTNRVESVLKEFKSKFSDKETETLINAELMFKKRDYNSAINILRAGISSIQNSDNRFTAYVILGDAFDALKNYNEATVAYSQALEIKHTISLLRKCGNSFLYLTDIRGGSESLYKKALECFTYICEEFTPNSDDVFNLAQVKMLLNDLSGSERVIKEYLVANGDDCKLCMLMAIVADKKNDSSAVKEYCIKSHKLYNSGGSSENIDYSIILQIKALYKQYCGGVW